MPVERVVRMKNETARQDGEAYKAPEFSAYRSPLCTWPGIDACRHTRGTATSRAVD